MAKEIKYRPSYRQGIKTNVPIELPDTEGYLDRFKNRESKESLKKREKNTEKIVKEIIKDWFSKEENK